LYLCQKERGEPMSDQEKELEEGEKPPRARRKRGDPLLYGKRTREVLEQINRQPENVFGKKVFTRMAELGYTVRDLMIGTGLWNDHFYLLLTQKSARSKDPELIFRLAGILNLPEAELLALYLESKASYFSPEYLNVYRMREYDKKAMASLSAAFVRSWESIVHSPRFEEASLEEQSTLALNSAQLLERFGRMSEEKQQILLDMAKGFAPDVKPVPVDAHARSEQDQQENIRQMLKERSRLRRIKKGKLEEEEGRKE
jgi:hypothetical protein